MSHRLERDRYSLTVEWAPVGGVFVASAMELPGCVTHGQTREEAVRQGRDAIESWIDAKRAWGRSVPEPRVGLRSLPSFLRPSELTFLAPDEPIDLDRYSMDLVWQPEDQVYVVTVRELEGCRTHGETDEEAIRQGREVIDLWISTQDGLRIPRPKHYELELAQTPA